MSFISVICGLKSEAAVVRAAGKSDKLRIDVSGASAARAYNLARTACQDGAAAVISIGVSGGLDPALQPGNLVIGDEVVADDGSRYEADRYLLSTILSAHSGESRNLGPQAMRSAAGDPGFRRDERGDVVGALFGSDSIVQSADHKTALHYNHNAVAVDMESHGAARAAAEFSAPFIAVRAIADPADRALPKAALNAVAPDGSTRVLATLIEMAKAPGDIPALMQLGSDSEKALKTLRRDLGPFFDRLFLALDL